MIPIKLTLRNFMCYRENVPPLSFAGIHTACICGDNGNGKSALVDAITWALWGKARAKSDIDLIAQGQTEMAIEFDFAIGEQVYRIIRKYARPKTRTGSGHPVLEFQAEANGTFRPISGNTVTQTQTKIIDTLHMDYDTFINSAFLRQGHADEFTNRRPAERKDVLASILGLSQYDEIEAKAKESMKIWEDLSGTLQTAMQEIDNELLLKPEFEAEMNRAQDELTRVSASAKQQDARLTELRKQKEALDGKKTQAEQLETYITATRKSIEEWSIQANQHRSRKAVCDELIANKAGIEEGYNHLVNVKKVYDELSRKLSLLIKLNERKNRLEIAVEKARSELLRDHAVTQRHIDDLKNKVEKLPSLKNEMQQLEMYQNKLFDAETNIENRRRSNQELRTHIGTLEVNLVQLQNQIKELDEKLTLLNTSDTRCPLCEQDLGTEERRRIDIKYNTEKSEKQSALDIHQKDLLKSRSEIVKNEKELAQLEFKLKQERAVVQGKLSILHQGISDAADAAFTLNEEQSKLGDIEQRLAKHDFAVNEVQALFALENEIAVLDYNQTRYEEIRQQLTEFAKYEEPKRRLEEAERLVIDEQAALERATNTTAGLNENLEKYTAQRQRLSDELTAYPQLSNDLAIAHVEYDNIVAEEQRAGEALGRAKQKLERCAELEARKQEKNKQAVRSLEQVKIYQELAEAFGKKGIQALLIEIAIPEIQEEADRLLAKMTDNRMHVNFDTQREKKTGGTAETLDINVSDELGTRNYEMFSGGEAFRINFAIRIALSRLLARRAGAPLPTLIIDEGFGTQDNTGIEKIKEAINSIENDFEKVLVITHIDELKDAFPIRIDVIKTAEGSTVTLN